MIPVWLPVAVPWAGAALLAALPRRPALAGPAVAAFSLAAAVALAVWGDGADRADVLGSALLLAGAVAALLAAVAAVGSAGTPGREGRFGAAGLPLLQGAQALALLAEAPAVAWIGLAAGSGAGVVMVALPVGRRAFAAAWRMLLLCGAGLALALLGIALLHQGRAAAPTPGLSNLGFVLALIGYGALAGLAPLHGWLPRAVAVSPPPVAALVAGLLPPAAVHALVRAAAAAGPEAGVLPPAALLVAVGLVTAVVAAIAAWRLPAAGAGPGWAGAGLAGLAAVGFGLGGAAGNSAGVLLLLGLPACVGAAVFGAAAGGPVAALGRASLAGMPPFVPFIAAVLLFSAVAALPAALALPLGAVLLTATGAQLAAAGRKGGGRAVAPHASRRGAGALVAGPAWVLLALALALGVALPEPIAAALAGAAAGIAR